MKKILIILVLIILIAGGLYIFLGNGKKEISDFFNAENSFGSFFDIDPTSNNTLIPSPETIDEQIVPTNIEYKAPVLRQISFEPVSGFTFYATTSTSTRIIINPEFGEVKEEYLETSTAIRFQERATGHIYDVFEFLQIPQKISNITIQKIYNTLFTKNNDNFLFQTLTLNNEQIRTAFAKVIPAKQAVGTSTPTEQTLEQREISTVMSEIAYLTDSDRILYSIKRVNGSDFYISDPERSKETLVTTIPFSELTIEPLNNTHVLVQTKASANSTGYAYTLNISNGSFTKFIGNIPGLLTKMSPSMEHYLYSESATSRPILRSYDVKSNTTRRIGIDTIPEKCAFSQKDNSQLYCFGSLQYKSAIYPDDWYKGKVSNPENLYQIDLATGVVQVVYVFAETEALEDFDVIKPVITNNDNFIIFQNKNDLTLWAINLASLNNQF